MTRPPGRRCTAHSTRTGATCAAYAIRGGTVCRAHGGAAPQVRRRARDRAELAEALAASPRRAPLEVLADVAHLADVMRARAVDAPGPATPERWLEAAEAGERAARLAKQVLDAQRDRALLWLATAPPAMVVAELRARPDGAAIVEALVDAAIRDLSAELGRRALPSGLSDG